MANILKLLQVVQERKVTDPFGFTRVERRLNPYNPISYLVVFGILVIGLLCYGLIGLWRETELHKEFKWR